MTLVFIFGEVEVELFDVVAGGTVVLTIILILGWLIELGFRRQFIQVYPSSQ
jgi:hypothetical protein